MRRKFNIYILPISLIAITFITGCRKRVTASDEDMSEYGWVLYSESKYDESNEWFVNAVFRDTTYKDGYNGQGWTYGKLGEIDSSIIRFEKGIQKANRLGELSWEDQKLIFQDHNPLLESIAGLTLAYHANNLHGMAIDSGLVFLEMSGDSEYRKSGGTLKWSFSRDENINSTHIIWTIASSYFAEGKYIESLDYSNRLNVVDSTFDVTTTAGIQKLAAEISRLRTRL